MEMKKSDVIVALVIGEFIALLSFGILKNLGLEEKLFYCVWPIFFPVFCLFSLWLAWLFNKKIPIIWQAAKFILVGVLNTIIDLGVLNLLMWIFNITAGPLYSVFKGSSFIVATINSYLWNKFWTFEKKETKPGIKESSQFFLVAGIGFLINVGVASFLVNILGPQFGLSQKIWANAGAITATFCGMTWNFLGYKFIVFKK